MSDEVIYDKKEQLQKIQAGLLPGETVEAVFDLKGGGTGFLGITSHRLIMFDQAFLQKMKAVVSIPYSQVHCVGAEDDGSFVLGRGFFASSKLALHTSHGEHVFEFRGADKAHTAHNLILSHMVR